MKANGQGFNPLFEKNYVGQFFHPFFGHFSQFSHFLGGLVGDTFAQNIGHDLSGAKKIPVARLSLDLPREKPKPPPKKYTVSHCANGPG